MDLSASVGFIHKESVTMHGHTIAKNCVSSLHSWSPMLSWLRNLQEAVTFYQGYIRAEKLTMTTKSIVKISRWRNGGSNRTQSEY